VVAARSSSAGRAFAKSAGFGALQANISASALLYLAYRADVAAHATPALSVPGDFGSFALIILIVGSIVGAGVGMLYSVVPSLVAHWRRRPTLGTTDRAMFASSLFMFVAAFVHASIANDAAVWLPLLVLAVPLATIALVRTILRARFLSRVRAGREPRYRIEEMEAGSTLLRIAADDEREAMYRENAAPPAEPTVVGAL
jgi:hypothetical protein